MTEPPDMSTPRSSPPASSEPSVFRTRSPMDLVGTGPAPSVGPHRPGEHTPRDVIAVREIFWHNVIREMLTALSAMVIERHLSPYDPATEQEVQSTFDGRLAVITTLGQRIPIAEVHPLFACSVPTNARSRALSMEVQCTVFQIRTPTGEIYTLPLHEIRSFHALTPELMTQIQQAAHNQSRFPGDEQEPFGFAAYTSLANAEMARQEDNQTTSHHEQLGHPPIGPGLGSMPGTAPDGA